MGWSTPDVYNEPDHFGLELVAMIERPDMSYEFDMFGIWRDASTGQVYNGQDSGCSCPSPFEGYTSLADLTEVKTAAELHKALNEWAVFCDSSVGLDASVVEGHQKIAELRFPIQGAVVRPELPAAPADAELHAAVTAAARAALTRAV
jgi:hypothetical protein